MRIRATAAMAAVLLCVAISGSAQTLPPGMVHLYGAGTQSCGRWLEERKGTNWDTLGQWVLGWVTAASVYHVRRALRDTDAKAIDAWVDEYCREHPDNELYEAAMSLVDELSKTK